MVLLFYVDDYLVFRPSKDKFMKYKSLFGHISGYRMMENSTIILG